MTVSQEAFRDKIQISERAQTADSRCSADSARTPCGFDNKDQYGLRPMNLNNVLPLPLDYSEYAKTAMKLVLEGWGKNRKQLLLHMQNVCATYACLAVKRNAGIVGTDAKHAAAARCYREIAVPGFFKWAQDNSIAFPVWLTMEKMGCSTLNGGEKETACQ